MFERIDKEYDGDAKLTSVTPDHILKNLDDIKSQYA